MANQLHIFPPDRPVEGAPNLPASKSESNRLLIIRALAEGWITLRNLSDAEDTQILDKLLRSSWTTLDAGHGGTTFRFMTAFMAIRSGREVVLTGSERMKERPVGGLVEALCSLGASIAYLEKDGYPPLRIEGRPMQGGTVTMDGSVSSQYITAVLLIAPFMRDGLTLHLKGEQVSRPYVKMTLRIMRHFGVELEEGEEEVRVWPGPYKGGSTYRIEADWTAASYWFEVAALAKGSKIRLDGLSSASVQGDAAISRIFEEFGLQVEDTERGIELMSKGLKNPRSGLWVDCSDHPDLAQTLACSAAGIGLDLRLEGLRTLRIKESDRIRALSLELGRLGVDVREAEEALEVRGKRGFRSPSEEIATPVNTYNDHRMAMAFAPLAIPAGRIGIADPDVVRKSYPGFWEELRRMGFTVQVV